MGKSLLYILSFVFSASLLFTSCKNDDEDNSEYANWQARNEAFFESIRTLALDSIRQAKNQYGIAWTSQCNWRTFLCYSLDSTITNKATDSIYVHIIKRGTGSGCPLGTDSCRLYYRGYLIPSANHPEGYIFYHSGQSSLFDKVFDHKTSVPSLMRPSTSIKGFGTALQNMHIGDLWKIYIPYTIGYGATQSNAIPAYSTLIFEVELCAYYRSGANVPAWN